MIEQPQLLLPFRSARKIRQLTDRGVIEKKSYPITTIPKHKHANRSDLQYKHVHGPTSWMVDIAFIASRGEVIQATEDDPGKMEKEVKAKRASIVLICIHCNSRFVVARILKKQGQEFIYPILKDLTQSKLPCDTIISDADPSISAAIKRIPAIKQHIIYNMSDPNNVLHTALSLIDRFTRTLRDMLYNMSRQATDKHIPFAFNEDVLNDILEIYNTTPHAGITKDMQLQISPVEMISYPELQEQYIKAITQKNTNYIHDRIAYDFKPGDIVYVYQPQRPFLKRRNDVEDYPYKVLACNGGRYILQNTYSNIIIQRPRSYLVQTK